MEFLCSEGFACVIHDHRGHGASVKSADDLGYFYSGGWRGIVSDILTVNEEIRKMYPESPVYLFGHSMGSLAVRSFTKRYDNLIDGLIVCGSPSRNPAAGAGKLLAKFIAAFKSDRHRPDLIQKIAFEGFNKNFSNEGRNAWLSTDKENVRAYNCDPLCNYQFTANGFIGLFDLMMDTYSDKGWNVSNPQLPIHFIAGSDDPCITSLKDFQAAADHMKKVGYACMTTKAYDGLRHEILNETGKEEVWSDILNYINGLLTSDNRAR
jgi:alpha-beta hydrolase superfamily lysophospholipase